MCINLAGLSDASRKEGLLARADAAWARTRELHGAAEEEILVKLREQA